MAQDVKLSLMYYRPLAQWKPKIGDLIIKHGWFTRTKWFGVINFMRPDGKLCIVRDGMIKLLVMTQPDAMPRKAIELSPDDIRSAVVGSYTVMQVEGEVAVWYV